MITHDSPIRLKTQGLTKSFSGVQVLRGVTFEARGGSVLGIVGENGSGKSTTLNVLAGVLQRDGGSVWLDGELFEPSSRRDADESGVAFIQQELNIFPNLTVAENLFLTRQPRSVAALPIISRKKTLTQTKTLLRSLDLEVLPDTLAGSLSPGERQLLEIARGLSANSRIFILDEPTTSLTRRETLKLFDVIQRLRQQGVAILYVSHNLEDVLQLSQDVVVMRDGQITMSRPTSELNASDLVVAMVGRPIEALFPCRRELPPSVNSVLEVRGLSEPAVLDNISLTVRSGEIVGIAGLMGSGRTELARALFGLDRYSAGVVRVGGKELRSGDIKARLGAGLAFLTEDRRHEGLMLEAPVADNMALAALPQFTSRFGKRVRGPDLVSAVEVLGKKMNLKSGDVRATLAHTLSGGNQQKIVFGRWLLRRPKVFILDEPTRGVDVGAKEEIYRLLVEIAEAGTAILMISSELEELIGLSDRILVMHRGALCAQFDSECFDREAILRAAFGQVEAA